MRQPGTSHALTDQSQPSWQNLPGQQIDAALKYIHAAVASVATANGGDLAPGLEAICRAVKDAAGARAQLWLIEEKVEKDAASRWLALRASSEGYAESATRLDVDLASDSVIARALREQRACFCEPLTNEAADAPLISALFPETAAVLLAPLVVDGQTLGLLTLLDNRPLGRFMAADLDVAQFLAGHAALAVQNMLLLVAAQERARTSERGWGAVTRASEMMASTLQLDEVSEQIVAVARALLGAQSAWLMVYDEETDLLRLTAISGWDAMTGAELAPAKSVAGEVFLAGQPMFVPDVQAEPLFAARKEAAEAGIVAMLGLPLLAQGRRVGVLGVNPAPDPDGVARNPLEGPDGPWLRLFAGQMAATVQNARLYDRLQTEHAFAEQLAQAAQRHAGEMETIFESMAEGVAVFDTSGQLVRLNTAGAALAGLSAAKLMPLSSTALGTGISEEVSEREFHLARHPLVMRALVGEVVTDEELVMGRGDGAQVSLRVSVAPLYDKQGEVTGAVAIMEDVTERQQYQREQLAVGWVAAALNHPLDLKETLDTSVEALTAALGADHSAIMLVDETQKALHVASVRGYGEELEKQFPVLSVDASVAPCVAFRTQRVQVSETFLSAPAAHPFHELLIQEHIQASLAVPLLVQDQALGVLIYSYSHQHFFSTGEQQVARAIADQIALAVVNARLYEEVADYVAWQENERRTLQAIIDALPAGVVLRDKDGQLFIYNEAALKMALNWAEVQTARQTGEAPIDPVWHIVGPDGAPVDIGFLPSQQAIQTGEPVKELQLFLRQHDGSIVPVLLNAAPVQDSDGNFTRGLAVFQDITALKELERHKDEFISVASHELRGPLTVIRGQAQLLQRQLRRQEKQGELPPTLLHSMESMESIQAQTARMNDLVNDLLDASRIQAGKLTLQRGLVELMPLLTKVTQHWKPASANHTLILETDGSTEDVKGYWDAKRVEQIFNNLLGNAMKYSPEGGNVTIHVQLEGEKHMLVGVRDEGLGIPPEATSHLFERFYRAGNVSSIGGTGLGLYISRQLATVHGGDLWAESPGLGKGTTFYLRLPLE